MNRSFSPGDVDEVVVDFDPDGVHVVVQCIDEDGELVEQHTYANPEAIEGEEPDLPGSLTGQA